MWSGDQIPIEDIFFVNLLNAKGEIERVIIFCHDTVKNTDQLFSETQLEYFEAERVERIVSKQMIYKEDSVATIVEKIRSEMGADERMDHMYLFTEDHRDVTRIWNRAFRDGDVVASKGGGLAYQVGLQYVLALGLDLGDHPVGKSFSSEQFIADGEDPVRPIAVPLGYKTSASTSTSTFLANPFSVLVEDSSSLLLQDAMSDDFLRFSTTSTNIYVCLKKTVTEYARSQRLETLVARYFPVKTRFPLPPPLSNANDGLMDEIHRMAWFDDNEKQARSASVRQLTNISLTWNFPDSSFGHAGLDAIFKRFHASATIPRITWYAKSGDPIVRLYKPTAEAWTATGAEAAAANKPLLQFHLSAQRAVLSINAMAQITLFVPSAASVADIRFPTAVIQQINQIMQLWQGNEIRAPDMASLQPWLEACRFEYSIAIPSTSRFGDIPSHTHLFRQFHAKVVDRTLTLYGIPLLEYVPILDNYFDHVLTKIQDEGASKSKLASKSFWSPETIEDDIVDEAVVAPPAPSAPTTSNIRFMQRPSDVAGFQLLERVATSASRDEDDAWTTTVLGEPGWTEHATSGNFLQVMSMYYADERKLAPEESREEDFRGAMVQAMTLDRFLKYHNGNLPALYKDAVPDDNDAAEDENYKDTVFAKRLNLNDEHQRALFHSVVASYESFLEHLRSAPSIEYAHVWDLYRDVNPDLFTQGLNLVLLRRGANNHKVQFVCPTVAYSSMSSSLDPEKNTAIILQKDKDTFVPLMYESQHLTVKRAPRRIQQMWDNCRRPPVNSLSPDVYPFRPSLPAAEVQSIVAAAALSGYEIVGQILQSFNNNKVVALQIKGLDAKQQAVAVPCLPSAVLEDIPQVMLNDANRKLLSYTVTRDRLSGLAYASGQRLPCKPRFRVVKEGIRQGLVTEANEFVATTPEDNNGNGNDDDELDEIEDIPYNDVDDPELLKEATEDPTALALRLESQFYHLYQMVVKQVLDANHKQSWQRQLQSVNITYENKVKFLQEEIQSLIKDHVHFQSLDPAVVKDVHDMLVCDDPKNNDERYCLQTETSIQTIFPKFNLVDPTVNNETMYAVRLSDELVRVRRVQLSFLTDGSSAAASAVVDYNLSDDEVVVPWSTLRDKNELKHWIGPTSMTVWDTAVPETAVDMMDAVEFVQDCVLNRERRVTGFWRTCFARPITETAFRSTCTMAPLLFLAQQHRTTPMPVSSARHVLWKAYAPYFDPLNVEKYQEHTVLLELLKAKDADEIRRRIMDETTYELNDVDWWVFCQSLHIPAFLIWDPQQQQQQQQPWIRLYAESAETTAYVFIQKHRRKQRNSSGRYAIVNRQFTLSELNTTALRDDQDRVIIQEI